MRAPGDVSGGADPDGAEEQRDSDRRCHASPAGAHQPPRLRRTTELALSVARASPSAKPAANPTNP